MKILRRECKGLPSLSVIIPAFNEANRLEPTLLSVVRYLERHPDAGEIWLAEIWVIDDGSTDDTARRVSAFAESFSEFCPSVRLLRHSTRRGKGAAVKSGVLAATGDFILVMDADGAASIEELERLWAVRTASGASIIIGSRAKPSRETRVQGKFIRKILGRTFTRMLWRLTPGIADTQCGFKLFERSAALALFSRQEESRYAYDVEILHAAQQNGYAIEEVPINWVNIPGSKVNLVGDSWDMFLALFRIEARSRTGAYKITG